MPYISEIQLTQGIAPKITARDYLLEGRRNVCRCTGVNAFNRNERCGAIMTVEKTPFPHFESTQHLKNCTLIHSNEYILEAGALLENKLPYTLKQYFEVFTDSFEIRSYESRQEERAIRRAFSDIPYRQIYALTQASDILDSLCNEHSMENTVIEYVADWRTNPQYIRNYYWYTGIKIVVANTVEADCIDTRNRTVTACISYAGAELQTKFMLRFAYADDYEWTVEQISQFSNGLNNLVILGNWTSCDGVYVCTIVNRERQLFMEMLSNRRIHFAEFDNPDMPF